MKKQNIPVKRTAVELKMVTAFVLKRWEISVIITTSHLDQLHHVYQCELFIHVAK